jgi:uncharacterized protein
VSIGNKVFRDPIHGLITFDKEKERLLLDIIDTPEFQRLRRIRQLGLSWVTYPTSVHDRFSHSLGTCHLMGRVLANLQWDDLSFLNRKKGTKSQLRREHSILLLKCAALLHDVGHGPFSHAFERFSGTDHEDYTKEFIVNPSSSIHRILKEFDNTQGTQFVDWISEIISHTIDCDDFWVSDLLSSQFDVDRIDYLLRDAYMCGVIYANFDLDWMIQNLIIGEIPVSQHDKPRKLAVNAEKGVHSLESFIISRYHMYEQVYYHKTTRGAETLLTQIFNRIKQLIKEESELPENSVRLSAFIQSKTLESYMALDDFYLLDLFKELGSSSKDEILRELCACLLERRLYKSIEREQGFEHDDPGIEAMKQEIGREKFEYYFMKDKLKATYYKDEYNCGAQSAEKSCDIWVRTREGKFAKLNEHSEIIKAITNKQVIKSRYYIHREFFHRFSEVTGGVK